MLLEKSAGILIVKFASRVSIIMGLTWDLGIKGTIVTEISDRARMFNIGTTYQVGSPPFYGLIMISLKK